MSCASTRAIADHLLDIGPEDRLLAITFRRYAQMTTDVVSFFADAGAPVVLLTDSTSAPGGRARDGDAGLRRRDARALLHRHHGRVHARGAGSDAAGAQPADRRPPPGRRRAGVAAIRHVRRDVGALRVRGLVAAALLLAAPGSAWAGPNTWTEAGTPGQFTGQIVREIEVAPTLPSRILVFTNVGVYRSEDGGGRSTPSVYRSLRLPADEHAAFDPTDANRVWATGPSSGTQTYLAIRSDGGASWAVSDDAGINSVVSQIAVDSDGTAYTGQFTDVAARQGRGQHGDSMSLTGNRCARSLCAPRDSPIVAYRRGPNYYLTRYTSGPGWLGVSPISPRPRLDLRDDVRIPTAHSGRPPGTGVQQGRHPPTSSPLPMAGSRRSTQDVALEVGYRRPALGRGDRRRLPQLGQRRDRGSRDRARCGAAAGRQHRHSATTLAGNINGL